MDIINKFQKYQRNNPYYRLLNVGLYETALFAYPEETIQFFMREARIHRDEYKVAKEIGLLK